MGKEERASPLPSLDWRLGLDTGPLGVTRMMARFAEEDGGVPESALERATALPPAAMGSA